MNPLLATIEFTGTVDHWKELISKEGYKLKRICTDCVTSGMLEKLCKKHPTLEELRLPEMPLGQKDLDNIADHLKKLTILHIKVEKDDHQMISFLDQLPNLKHLKMESNGEFYIYGGYNWLNFSEIDNHGLEVLELTNMAQSNSDLSWYNWFKCFPHLTTIKLKDCILNDWTDFLAHLSWLEKLECLVLDNVVERNGTCGNDRAGSRTYGIKVLKIRGGEMSSKAQLATLVNRSPKLETIYLLNVYAIEDSVLEALQQKAQVSEFHLNDNFIDSDSSCDFIKQIIDLCQNLKKTYKL